MKKLRAIVVLVLAAALMLCLTGCGAKSELAGKWKTDINFGDYCSELLDDSVVESLEEELGADMSALRIASDYFGDVKLPYYIDLKSDGTYLMHSDQAALEADLRSATRAWCVDFWLSFLDLVEADKSEYGSTDEEVVETLIGTSIDEYVDSIWSGVFEEDMLDAEGKYKAYDGKLWLSAGLEYLPDESMYYTYTLNDKVLTLHDDLDIDEGLEWMYPMTLEYIGEAD